MAALFASGCDEMKSSGSLGEGRTVWFGTCGGSGVHGRGHGTVRGFGGSGTVDGGQRCVCASSVGMNVVGAVTSVWCGM